MSNSKHFADPRDLVHAVGGFDVIVGMRERTCMRERTWFPRSVFERPPGLKLLVTTGMRNASIDVHAARSLGIEVCGTRAHPESTSQLTWALMLARVRRGCQDGAVVRSGGWQTQVASDLNGATLGIVGRGRQRGRVAAVGRAFGLDVVACSPHLTADRRTSWGLASHRKGNSSFGQPFLSLQIARTPKTIDLISTSGLESMQQDAHGVNTSRWEFVAHGALKAVLDHELIVGAGLDVVDIEALPTDHWIRDASPVVLSPHMVCVASRNYRLFYRDAAEDTDAFIAGTPIRTIGESTR